MVNTTNEVTQLTQFLSFLTYLLAFITFYISGVWLLKDLYFDAASLHHYLVEICMFNTWIFVFVI